VPRLEYIDVNLGLPFGLGSISGRWAPDEHERTAAWEMYVELVTRISVEALGPDEGLLRDALNSLYSLFATTRGILRDHGPTVARRHGDADQSFGSIAVAILNRVLRPVLSTWHPRLLDYEAERPPDVSAVDHERAWDQGPEMRATLQEVRTTMGAYADLLAKVADVAPPAREAGVRVGRLTTPGRPSSPAPPAGAPAARPG
jgi:hypothetical protein